MRLLVELQLDPQMDACERNRQLREALGEVQQLQLCNRRAIDGHWKRRCGELKQRGIKLSSLRKSFGFL